MGEVPLYMSFIHQDRGTLIDWSGPSGNVRCPLQWESTNREGEKFYFLLNLTRRTINTMRPDASSLESGTLPSEEGQLERL